MTRNPFDDLTQKAEAAKSLLRATAKEVANFHRRDDLDSATLAHHHTLGSGIHQAAPGSVVKNLITTVDELAETQAALGVTQGELAATQAALATTQADLATTQADLIANTANLQNQVDLLSFYKQVTDSTYVRRTKGAAQNIAITTDVLVTFPTVVNATGYITVAGDNVFTVTEAGIYLVTAWVTWAAGASGRRILAINKNGVETARDNGGSVTTGFSQTVADTIPLAVGDNCSIEVNHNNGAALDITLGGLAIKRIA